MSSVDPDQCIVCSGNDDLFRLPCLQCNTASIENVKWVHKECLKQHILTYEDPNDYEDNDIVELNDNFIGGSPVCPYCHTKNLKTEVKIELDKTFGRWLGTLLASRDLKRIIITFFCFPIIIWKIEINIPWWIPYLEISNRFYYFIIFLISRGLFEELDDLLINLSWTIRDVTKANKNYSEHPIKSFKIVYDE